MNQSFRLTIRNVNQLKLLLEKLKEGGFRLTIRNVNLKL